MYKYIKILFLLLHGISVGIGLGGSPQLLTPPTSRTNSLNEDGLGTDREPITLKLGKIEGTKTQRYYKSGNCFQKIYRVKFS